MPRFITYLKIPFLNKVSVKDMSFKFEHQDDPKTIEVGALNDVPDEGGVKVKNSGDQQNYPIFDASLGLGTSTTPENDDLGYDFITNKDKLLPAPSSPEFGLNRDSDENIEEDKNDTDTDSIFGNEEHTMPRQYSHVNNNCVDGNFEDVQDQKSFYIYQLKRLEARGHIPNRRLGMEHSLEDIKGEVKRIKKELEVERGVAFCKQGLIFCTNTIEMLNSRYDPFGVELDGWSGFMMSRKDDYEEVFEELYEKYNSSISMAPELKLISMVASSAMMFHLQKSLSKSHIFGGIPAASGKMKGPSIDTDDLMDKLNDNGSDVFSDINSVTSEQPSIKHQISIPVPAKKKRGRKPKNP